jgi:hypothetical protein
MMIDKKITIIPEIKKIKAIPLPGPTPKILPGLTANTPPGIKRGLKILSARNPAIA